MTRPRRPGPPPLETNEVLISAIGAVAFAVAFVVLFIIPLAPDHHWWRWVCVTGFAMGVFGCWYIPRLHRGRAAAAARHAAAREHSDT
jgi:H+/Cl- antiporter ClcA